MKRVALVTGGAGGLGRATADRLLADGFAVAIGDLERALEAAAPIDGARFPVPLDVTREESVARAFDDVERTLGRVAVLVCCAGGTHATQAHQPSLKDTSLDDWVSTEALNARGAFLCAREMLRRRSAAPEADGRIILVASTAAQRAAPAAGAAYSAAKASVVAIGRAAALEAAPLGMTCNVIAPGGFDTGAYHITTREDQMQRQTAGIPLGRLGRPQEFADLASFLASAASGYITGATIDINGGARMA